MNTGIYKIENIITGDLYIGQSSGLIERKCGHWGKLRRNIHYNTYLQRAWNKYNEDNFVFKIILFCEICELTDYEQKLIDKWQPVYNIRRECVISNLGITLSESTKQKMSVAKTGKKHPNFGKHISNEQKIKLSEAKKGINHPNFGKHLSNELRRKLSKSHIGKHHSEETKRKISEALCRRRSIGQR